MEGCLAYDAASRRECREECNAEFQNCREGCRADLEACRDQCRAEEDEDYFM